jgi:putative ABC transport system permease protein
VTFIDDCRYAFRAVGAHPLVAAAITLILSVAVGANTAVFALVNSVLLSPLPFRDADRLVTVQQTRADSAEEPLSIPDYRDLRDGTQAFDQMAAAFQWSANVTGGEAERVQGMKLTALAFGAAPAVRLSGAASGTSLRGARAASPSNRRLRTLSVAIEVALASALVTLALLLSQSVARLQAVDPGFAPARVLTMRLSLPRGRYRHPADAQWLVEMLRPRLMALPGVIDAAAVNVVPLNGYHATADVWPAARPAPPADQRPQAEYRMVSPSYLRTFGIPLLAGRSLEDGDNSTGEPVVLVSRTLARRFWDVGTAVGQMIAMDDSDETRRARIVGVVGDVKHYGLDAEMTPDIYVPIPQVPDVTIQWLANNMYWGIRTSTDPAVLREAVRRELRSVDPDVPASAMRTMEEALSLALAPRRVNLWLVRAFAIIALLLAAAGVYAVTAFSVTLRARELAIRSALGARQAQNLRSVLVDAVRPIGAGLIVGAAVALVAVPGLGAVLFGVERFAAAPVFLVSAALLVVGLAAALAAARPVRRIDPIDALKAE